MGRYLTPTASVGSNMRNELHAITSSTPALPVPVWAKLAVVTLQGGGAGGGDNGNGGGAGGIAYRALVPLNGAATVAIVIGAGGAGAAVGSGTAGGNGGASTVTAGTTLLKCEGGSGSGGRGYALMGNTRSSGFLEELTNYPSYGGTGDYSGGGPLMSGGQGVNDTGIGSGGFCPFGAGGIGAAANASGYGAGGGGASGAGGGNGAPGMAIIEFLEAL